MAISIDWGTRVITIPQSYLTNVTGTLYELDTDQFRLDLKDLEDDTDGMAFPDTHRHNTTVTVAGTTFAQVIEIINGYSVEFEDGAYSVRLVGSNNNIFDVENGVLAQNQVQVIPTNSAGLIVLEGGAAATPAQIAAAVWTDDPADYTAPGTMGEIVASTVDPPDVASIADAVWDELASGHTVPGSVGDVLTAAATLLDTEAETGLTVLQALRIIAAATAGKVSGAGTTTVTIRNAEADDTDRIVATVDADGNRTAVVLDAD